MILMEKVDLEKFFLEAHRLEQELLQVEGPLADLLFDLTDER